MRTVELPAEPAAISIDLDRTAMIVVDMQNAFASSGGLLDLAGIDVRPARDAIANASLVREAARVARLPVFYLTIGYPPDLSTAGGVDSPNPQKELALCLMRERPELRGKLLTFGTWDFAIVDELAPEPGDVVIVKSRYSGFHGTDLDSVLRGRAGDSGCPARRPFLVEVDRLTPPFAGAALRADRAAPAKRGATLGHGRAIHRNAQPEGALVGFRFA